jgi:hypothetical protein
MRTVLSLVHEIPPLPHLRKHCDGSEDETGRINLQPRRIPMPGHDERYLCDTARSSNPSAVAESPFANVRMLHKDAFCFKTPKPRSGCTNSLGSTPSLPDLNLDMVPMPQRRIMLNPKKRKMPNEFAHLRQSKIAPEPTVTPTAFEDFVFLTPNESESG